MSNVTLQFLGATQTVTGSRFLISTGENQVLIDAGLFQGTKEIKELNWKPFPVEPSSIEAVVLTHAHLDHCGYLPLLVKQGFSGPIYVTEYTQQLAEVVLRDSARIQVEDAKFATKKGYSSHKPALALYDEGDALKAIGQMEVVEFRKPVKAATDITVTFHPSGHILGASFVTVDAADKSLLFSGDLGRPQHPILTPPDPIPSGPFDAILCESTYGDRTHDTPTSEFAKVINETIQDGGSILIPAFAVDRTEVILVKLRELIEAGEIPQIPIYADSPMALSSLHFYRDAINHHSPEIRKDIADEWDGRDPFDPGTLKEMKTVDESKSLNNIHTPSIIVSASGMATGGRVVHHLAHMLANPKNTIIMVGYQAIGTRGRQLTDGAEEVKIHGDMVPVNARIAKVEAFSVHADGDELIEWLKGTQKPKVAYAIHGEAEAAEIFAKRLSSELGWNTVLPEPNQTVTV
jgi:metallo-beta-lactamase family protein